MFVYLGGDQEVPREITHAVIDKSVNTARRRAFADRRQLVSVIFHDGVEIIEEQAFWNCYSLRGIKLLGVRDIRNGAFQGCFRLSDVEFGDRLETIGDRAFDGCIGLRSIKLPSVRTVQDSAFSFCKQLNCVEFGFNFERIGSYSFYDCPKLQRIAIPLKENIFHLDTFAQRYNQFSGCTNLTVVDLVGADGIHNTISSFLLKSWRYETKAEIDHINRELSNALSTAKANAIRLWIESVINRMEHYKTEHNRLLKEHMTQLELAIWKTKLDSTSPNFLKDMIWKTMLDKNKDDSSEMVQAIKRAKIDETRAKEEKRITSGADIIIKNVLPFLKLL